MKIGVRGWMATGAAVALLTTGCKEKASSALGEKMTAMLDRQEQFEQRIAACEAQTRLLVAKLEQKPAPAVAKVLATNLAPVAAGLDPAMAEALAGVINDVIARHLEERIDARIASQVGTARDIEQLAAEVVNGEFEAREQRRREESEQRQREWRERRQRQEVDRMAQAVGIDDAQKERVFIAYTNMQAEVRQAMSEMREAGNTDETAMRQAYDAVQDGYQAEVQRILTAEQYDKYQTEWRAARTNSFWRGGRRFGGGR